MYTYRRMYIDFVECETYTQIITFICVKYDDGDGMLLVTFGI